MWPAFTLVLHWNWRGQADDGTFGDGGWKWCLATNNCVTAQWRHRAFAQQIEAGFLYDPNSNGTLPYGWFGTLKEDGTGTFYRRNRHVDPNSGRFTQEDPIGLAGGLNLYGFAAGDPVNFSDPFGLCPDFLKNQNGDCPDQQLVNAAMTVEPRDGGALVFHCSDGWGALELEDLVFELARVAATGTT